MATISYCFIVLSVFIACTFGGDSDSWDYTLQRHDLAVFVLDYEWGLLKFVIEDGVNPEYEDLKQHPNHINQDVLFLLKPRKPNGEMSHAYKHARTQIEDIKTYKNEFTALYEFKVAGLSFGTLEFLEGKGEITMQIKDGNDDNVEGRSITLLLQSVQFAKNLSGKDTAKDDKKPDEPYDGPFPKDSLAIYKTNSYVHGLMMFVAEDGVNPQAPEFSFK